MLEIRADKDADPATPDGPHNPEQTRAIAEAISEAARLLNYTTMKNNGLRYPSDVYSVLGALHAAVLTLPQALRQMAEWVDHEVGQGAARENPHHGPHGGNADAAAAALRRAMADAKDNAEALAEALSAGQASMRGMETTRDDT